MERIEITIWSKVIMPLIAVYPPVDGSVRGASLYIDFLWLK